MRDKPKPKPPLNIKTKKSKECALLHQNLTFEGNTIAEDDSTSETYEKQDTSILVNSEAAKNSNPGKIHNLLSAIHKKDT